MKCLYFPLIFICDVHESLLIASVKSDSLLYGAGFGHFYLLPPLEVISFMIMHFPIDHYKPCQFFRKQLHGHRGQFLWEKLTWLRILNKEMHYRWKKLLPVGGKSNRKNKAPTDFMQYTMMYLSTKRWCRWLQGSEEAIRLKIKPFHYMRPGLPHKMS